MNNTTFEERLVPNVGVVAFVVKTILYAFILVTGCIGNLILLIILTKKKEMFKIGNCLVLNLAIVDLAIVFLTIPLSMMPPSTPWPFGEFSCFYLLPVLEHFAGVCVLTHTALSLIRWYAVAHVGKQKITVNKVRFVIAFIWIVSFLLMSAPLYGLIAKTGIKPSGLCRLYWKPNVEFVFFITVFFVTYVLPIIVTGISYIKIHKAVSKNVRNLNGCLSEAALEVRKRKRIIMDKAFMTMFMMFAISTLPIQIYYLLRSFDKLPKVLQNRNFLFILQGFFYSQVVWNPLIIFILSEDFRNEMRELAICKCFRKTHRSQLSVLIRRKASGILKGYKTTLPEGKFVNGNREFSDSDNSVSYGSDQYEVLPMLNKQNGDSFEAPSKSKNVFISELDIDLNILWLRELEFAEETKL